MNTQIQKYGIGIFNTLENIDYSAVLGCNVTSDSVNFDFLPLKKAREEKKYGKFIKNNVFFEQNEEAFAEYSFLYIPKSESGRVDIEFSATVSSSAYILIAIDNDAQVDIVEHYNSPPGIHVQVDLVAIAGSHVEYIKDVRKRNAQIQTCHRAKIMAGSSVIWNEYIESHHNTIARTQSYLKQPGANSQIKSIIYSKEKGIADVVHNMFHLAAMTTSNIQTAGLAKDESKGIYRSNIYIDAGAVKASGHQKAHFLQLSSKSEVDAVPQLEVHCHDVVCTHGVSITRYKPEHIFYMRSKGIEDKEAEKMLELGHVRAILDTMSMTAQSTFENILSYEI